MEPDNQNQPNLEAAANLQDINLQLETLKDNLLRQFLGEIEQLQERKQQLQSEIAALESNRGALTNSDTLAHQLAPALAQELQLLLQTNIQGDRLDNGEEVSRLVSAVDSTIRSIFLTLQQDLSSYQSSLSQQLNTMYTLEQQGEAILDTLVSRLRSQLQKDLAENRALVAPDTAFPSTYAPPSNPLPPVAEAAPTPKPPKPKAPLSAETKTFRLGIALVLFASLALSLQNVVISIILNSSSLFGGVIETGGYLNAGFGNSVLILFLRMVVLVPAAYLLGQLLYPPMLDDIQEVIAAKKKSFWYPAIGSGLFLFLSQIFIYTALGPIAPGVAITIFFIFPVVTVLLNWWITKDQPSWFRWGVIGLILLGVALINVPTGQGLSLDPLAVLAAIASGITFAVYVILTQQGTKKIHPIPFSFINFSTILLFSFLSWFVIILKLPFLPSSWVIQVDGTMWSEVLLSGVVLGFLSLSSYLANNVGIKYIGGSLAAIFGATGPVLTSLLQIIITGKELGWSAWLGMLIVTAGVLLINLEKIILKPKSP